MPPSGHCNFDHTVVPDAEREHCFHKQACVYKPNCIFFHPEGQKEEVWEHSKKKAAKICKYAEQGLACLRNICNFYHPAPRNNVGHHKQPPLQTQRVEEMTSTMIPMRIPVIVKNTFQTRKEFPELSVSLEGLAID